MLTRCTYSNAILRCIVYSPSSSRNSFRRLNRILSTSLSHGYPILSIPMPPNNKATFCVSCRSFSMSSSQSSSVVQFKLADIGEGIREVELLEWFVEVGDRVKQFDKICEVQSDKANVTIISRYDGTIVKLHHNVSGIAKVGQPLVDIQLAQSLEELIGTKTATIIPDEIPDKSMLNNDQSSNILATPAIRQMAKALQIPLNDVQGTGKDGRILRDDLVNYKTKQSDATKISSLISSLSSAAVKQTATFRPAPITSSSSLKKTVHRPAVTISNTDRSESIQGIRKTMVKTMTQANSIPHFTYCDEYDMTPLRQLRKTFKIQSDTKQHSSIWLLPFIIKACSQALLDYPILNSHVDSKCETITYKSSHNIGITINTKDGLLVPNIKGVQQLSIDQITRELNRLQQLATNGKLSPADLQDGTFSIIHIGTIGGTYTVPVLFSPQVAIGAFGKVVRQAVSELDDEQSNDSDKCSPSEFRSMMSVSWSADHRVVDGATMARFSNKLKSLLENPLHMFFK